MLDVSFLLMCCSVYQHLLWSSSWYHLLIGQQFWIIVSNEQTALSDPQQVQGNGNSFETVCLCCQAVSFEIVLFISSNEDCFRLDSDVVTDWERKSNPLNLKSYNLADKWGGRQANSPNFFIHHSPPRHALIPPILFSCSTNLPRTRAIRLTKMVLVLVVVYLVSVGPYHILQLVNLTVRRPTLTYHTCYYLSVCLSYAASSINPFIYILLSRHFRRRMTGRKPSSVPSVEREAVVEVPTPHSCHGWAYTSPSVPPLLFLPLSLLGWSRKLTQTSIK